MMDDADWQALLAHIRAHPVEGNPAEMRRAFARLAPPPVAGKALEPGGVPCLSFGAGGPPLVWVHGGGLVFGSPETHSAMASYLAGQLGRAVIVPRYALAPEHRAPAQRDDVLAVVDALDGPVDLGGDSAGGQLAILAALHRPDAVRALALISPNTDRSGQSVTRIPNSPSDAMNDHASDLRLAKMAFGENLAADPDASPLVHELSALPPVWISAATSEVLLDDTLLFIRALGQEGVPVAARIERGLCHMWPLWPDRLAQARATLEAIAHFLNAAPVQGGDTSMEKIVSLSC